MNYESADTSGGTTVRLTGPQGARLCFVRTLAGSTSYVQIDAAEGVDISSDGGTIPADQWVAIPCEPPRDSAVTPGLDPSRPTMVVQSTGATVQYRFTAGGL